MLVVVATLASSFLGAHRYRTSVLPERASETIVRDKTISCSSAAFGCGEDSDVIRRACAMDSSRAGSTESTKCCG